MFLRNTLPLLVSVALSSQFYNIACYHGQVCLQIYFILTLCFDLVTGNFPTVTRVLLAKIPQQDGKMTYQYDNYNFHYIGT